MKTMNLLVPALLATAVSSLFAAPAPAAALPTILVQAVTAPDLHAYNSAVYNVNSAATREFKLSALYHTYVGDVAGENSGVVFVVSQYASIAAMVDLDTKMANDPMFTALHAQLKAAGHAGSTVLYKAVRFDGLMIGGSVFSTSVVCTDEDAYLKLIDGLKAILVANNFGSVKVNLLRAVSGRSASTHLVVLSADPTYLAQALDLIQDKGLLKTWNVDAAKVRTTVQNGTYHEF